MANHCSDFYPNILVWALLELHINGCLYYVAHVNCSFCMFLIFTLLSYVSVVQTFLVILPFSNLLIDGKLVVSSLFLAKNIVVMNILFLNFFLVVD